MFRCFTSTHKLEVTVYTTSGDYIWNMRLKGCSFAPCHVFVLLSISLSSFVVYFELF